MSKLYLAVLIFTFASGFGGIGYRAFASKMLWPVGSSWGKPVLNILCFGAMLIAVSEAWAAYGGFTAGAVALAGLVAAYVLMRLLKQHIQTLNLVGIIAGSVCSLLGPSVLS